MKRHRQIRKEQASLHEKLKRKDIKVEDFVLQFRLLKEELNETEQKMYNEHDTCILSLDTKINLLQKENLLLNNKIGLLDFSLKKSKNLNLKLIKKDKQLYKLKQHIKSNFLNFNEEMLPKSYLRISTRFPHLNLHEIINFEKLVIENGGSIEVHSGNFILTQRATHTYCNAHGSCQGDFYISWTCCHSYLYTGSGSNMPMRLYIKKPIKGDNRPPNREGAKNLKNSSPISECDYPETFHLNEEDEKLQDVKEVKVSDVSSSISNNIKVLEKTIEEYSNKILKLKSLQETLDLLVDT